MEVWRAGAFLAIAAALTGWTILLHRRDPGLVRFASSAAALLTFAAGFVLIGRDVDSAGTFFFYLFGVSGLAAGVCMITARHPLHGALWLLACMASLSGVLVVLDAELVAMTQLVVFSSGILVLYLASLMMVEIPDKPLPGLWLSRHSLATLVAALLFAGIAAALIGRPAKDVPTVSSAGASIGAPDVVARELLARHGFAFEVTALLLLATAVAAVYLTRRERTTGGSDPEHLT